VRSLRYAGREMSREVKRIDKHCFPFRLACKINPVPSCKSPLTGRHTRHRTAALNRSISQRLA
jgi:hypothetical protein